MADTVACGCQLTHAWRLTPCCGVQERDSQVCRELSVCVRLTALWSTRKSPEAGSSTHARAAQAHDGRTCTCIQTGSGAPRTRRAGPCWVAADGRRARTAGIARIRDKTQKNKRIRDQMHARQRARTSAGAADPLLALQHHRASVQYSTTRQRGNAAKARHIQPAARTAPHRPQPRCTRALVTPRRGPWPPAGSRRGTAAGRPAAPR